ncbi:M56 family metallopeptidase [Lutispora sp.]|uniref:M56 family metallopeptidase n=1 Tax=Lutispora sp. TaxID=2828727 RepID=UPI002B1EB114|nr:M56 family metallopeptidase [Lutispora sp.]MEA4962346.1 M56 family metallopeptidase [Lutispora sp.]
MLHFRMDMPLYLMALYGSMMIAVVLLLRSLLRNRLPKFVFPLLWGLVLVRLLIPFSLSSPISAPVPEWQMRLSKNPAVYVVENAVTTNVTAQEDMDYSFAESTDGQLVLMSVFILGAAATAGILLSQKLRYSRRLKNSLLVEHNQTINTMLRDMGMGHILVFTSDEIASPLVCGIWNPHIYLPAGMDFRQSQTLRHILSHETMHIKRKDNWTKLVMLLALCLHWYNPLVWLMSKFLSSDLEVACDAAVLRQTGVDERQSYAASLLSMAITGNRSTLLYSAFSKTEVERRIKNVLGYKRATAFVLTLSILFILCTTIVFATGGQAPFSAHFSSYCSSTSSRWGVKAGLTRDIAFGENADRRADNTILDVLDADTSNDPDIIANRVQAALAEEFKVEKGAFRVVVGLCLDADMVAREYASQGITKGQDGYYLYNGEAVRAYTDEMLGMVQTQEKGVVDISVQRNRLGEITSVTVLRKGDAAFDQHSKKIERSNRYNTVISSGAVTEQVTVIEDKIGGNFLDEQ